MQKQLVTKKERRINEFAKKSAEPVHIAGQPRVMRLKIDLIKMADYQRKPSSKVVNAIIDEYDPNRDRPIEVSFRDGAHWCFDGQHRLRAHEIMKKDTILAQVHFGLTYEQEAALFAKQHQNERKVGAKDLWDAAVKAGKEYPDIQAIIEICNEFGFKIQPRSSCKEKNTITCIQAVQSIYNKFGAQALKDVLFVVSTAWPDMPNNTHREIFTGFIKMLEAYNMHDAEWNRIRDRLAKISPEQFLMKANTHTGRGGKCVALQIVRMCNSGLKEASPLRFNEFKIR